MAIVHFKEFEVDAETSVLQSNRYVRKFRIKISQDRPKSIAWHDALTAPKLPPRGSALNQDLTVRASGRRLIRTENSRIFIVEVEYEKIENSEEEEQSNPLEKRPEIAWGFRERTIVLQKTFSGDLVINSAGDPFDPPPEVSMALPTVTIVRNEEQYDPGASFTLINSVNRNRVTIAGLTLARRKARCLDFSGVRRFENDITFFEVTYVIECRVDTHDFEILDQGIYNSAGKRIILEDKTFADQPVNLIDGVFAGAQGEAQFLNFRIYSERNFAAMRLPRSL